MSPRRWLALLTLLLVFQLGVLGSRYWAAAPLAPTNEAPVARLLPAGMNAAEILISDEYDNETVLSRRGQRWVLPELLGLPASAEKVDALLAVIDADKLWPVARTSAARQRFQVADYLYQRRIALRGADGATEIIYLGTSPGFRKVHARNDAREDIHSVTLNIHDVPAFSGAWLDPRLLQVRTPLGIDADSYSLRFENGVWISAFGGTPDTFELEALLDTLRSLQVEGVADEATQRDLMDAEAALELRVTGLAGDVTLELFAFEEGHFILSSEYPLFFKLTQYDFDRLTGIDFSLISGE
ncbi:MAG: hypothetical protein ACPG1A_06945 [Halioglobus sp.]